MNERRRYWTWCPSCGGTGGDPEFHENGYTDTEIDEYRNYIKLIAKIKRIKK